jgi:hypothetical protein
VFQLLDVFPLLLCWVAFGFTAMRMCLVLFQGVQFKICEWLVYPHQYYVCSPDWLRGHLMSRGA